MRLGIFKSVASKSHFHCDCQVEHFIGLEAEKRSETVGKLAGMIARREGVGDLLAEGLLRAGERLGEKATRHFPNEAAGVGDGAAYSAQRKEILTGMGLDFLVDEIDALGLLMK